MSNQKWATLYTADVIARRNQLREMGGGGGMGGATGSGAVGGSVVSGVTMSGNAGRFVGQAFGPSGARKRKTKT